jgi:hypothetical protein
MILNIDRYVSGTLDLALERSRALDRVCAQGVAARLGILPAEGLAEAPLARSEEVEPGGGVLVVKRRGVAWRQNG